MKIVMCLVLLLCAACSKTSEAELQKKIDDCTAAGMNYTYLKDYKGQPYDVMCVAKRLR